MVTGQLHLSITADEIHTRQWYVLGTKESTNSCQLLSNTLPSLVMDKVQT